MKQQGIGSFILLSIITLGIYDIFWLAGRRGEMVRKGSNIPTTWLIIIPFVNYWYYWKWSQGVEKVTNSKMQGVIAFLLVVVLGFVGMAIVQDAFNNVAEAPTVAPAQPIQ